MRRLQPVIIDDAFSDATDSAMKAFQALEKIRACESASDEGLQCLRLTEAFVDSLLTPQKNIPPLEEQRNTTFLSKHRQASDWLEPLAKNLKKISHKLTSEEAFDEGLLLSAEAGILSVLMTLNRCESHF